MYVKITSFQTLTFYDLKILVKENNHMYFIMIIVKVKYISQNLISCRDINVGDQEYILRI